MLSWLSRPLSTNMAARQLSARDAAFRAMEEVSGPVIAVVLVLAAVFLPTAALSRHNRAALQTVRCHYRRLGSDLPGFVALTLTPALCSLWLKPHHGPRRGLFGWFNRGFDRVTNLYGAGVSQAHPPVASGARLLAVMLFCTWRLFNTVPGSFVPPEDQGYVLVAAIFA